MTPPSAKPASCSGSFWPLAGLLLLALLLRLVYFTGMSLGDDVFYGLQALAHSQGAWPPEQTHWTTRLGITLPAALSLWAFGPQPWAFVLWPLLASTLSVLVCFLVARDLTDTRTAWLATIFQTAFPLELIFATHLFPDVPAALFAVLSLWYWVRALRDDRRRDYLLCGAFFAAGYLCRETIFLNGPVYLALWALAGKWRRPRLLLVALVPLLVIGLESILHAATSGDPLYRWQAMKAQQQDDANLALISQRFHGGGFWTDPLLMTASNPGFGLYYLAALPLAVVALWRWPMVRPLALWLLVGFFWLYYGTTLPWAWVTQSREARYAAGLTISAVILLASALNRLRPKPRYVLTALFLGTGLCAASLDQGSASLTPHETFLQTPYASEAVLEPFEYLGVRWQAGWQEPLTCRCATDLGSPLAVRLLRTIDGSTFAPAAAARYVVFSPERRPALRKQLAEAGWIVALEVPGQSRAGRALAARVLAVLPGQQARAERIAHPTGLIVMERPLP